MMHQKIDFYLLNQPTFRDCLLFAVQLAQKAYKKNTALHIELAEHAETLDRLLWSVAGFLPHQVDKANQTITVNRLDQTPTCCLRLTLPEQPQPCQQPRLLQIVPNDPNLKTVAREHYKYYRQHNATLNTHTIKGTP